MINGDTCGMNGDVGRLGSIFFLLSTHCSYSVFPPNVLASSLLFAYFNLLFCIVAVVNRALWVVDCFWNSR
ncbi:hypothetical protein L1987_36218 [Smallanthus sonchifolius]|uniref:Uncharacterized protein n=1 Tax=Smallanthus sonchifolius TaxID=185202 RepID=A0ACB9HCJ1_9ASTR|nr:hypothetical protein L1987_36218 [Smallanthus sonchifolius]